jgi:hypothetical protein
MKITNPQTGVVTETISTPQLLKGDIAFMHGAKFEILEDARNVSNNDLKLPNERTDLDGQAFGAKAKFLSYEDGSGKTGDSLLENYDWFQGNSYAKTCIKSRS